MYTPDRELQPPDEWWGDDELNEIEEDYMQDIEDAEIIEETINEPKELVRSFGGKINDFSSKGEQEFEKRHLKAYLKGSKQFRCGYITNSNGMREENWFNVIENWK